MSSHIKVKLHPGIAGKSAYEHWLDQGHKGSVKDFLNWLRHGGSIQLEDVQGLLEILDDMQKHSSSSKDLVDVAINSAKNKLIFIRKGKHEPIVEVELTNSVVSIQNSKQGLVIHYQDGSTEEVDLGLSITDLPQHTHEISDINNLQEILSQTADEKDIEQILSALDAKADKSEMATIYRVKGSVEDVGNLLGISAEIGDVYNTLETDMNYVWTGTEWDPLGSTIDLKGLATQKEIENISLHMKNLESSLTNLSEELDKISEKKTQEHLLIEQQINSIQEDIKTIYYQLSFATEGGETDLGDVLKLIQEKIAPILTQLSMIEESIKDIEYSIEHMATKQELAATEKNIAAKVKALEDNILEYVTKIDLQKQLLEMQKEVNNKVDKIEGKGLSTEDFTTELKDKLATIEEGADKTPSLDHLATKEELNDKVDKVAGKGLSTEDFTTELKNKLESIGEASAHGVEFESIKNRPTTLKGYGIVDGVTKKELEDKVSSVYRVKGSVATYSSLPENAETGDVYNVISTGMNYVWEGEGWDALGSSLDTSDFVTQKEKEQLLTELGEEIDWIYIDLENALNQIVAPVEEKTLPFQGDIEVFGKIAVRPTRTDNLYRVYTPYGIDGRPSWLFTPQGQNRYQTYISQQQSQGKNEPLIVAGMGFGTLYHSEKFADVFMTTAPQADQKMKVVLNRAQIPGSEDCVASVHNNGGLMHFEDTQLEAFLYVDPSVEDPIEFIFSNFIEADIYNKYFIINEEGWKEYFEAEEGYWERKGSNDKVYRFTAKVRGINAERPMEQLFSAHELA